MTCALCEGQGRVYVSLATGLIELNPKPSQGGGSETALSQQLCPACKGKGS